MKNIVVTGAGGYIGRHVVEALIKSGHKVSAVDFRTDGITPDAEIINVDIFSGDSDIYQQLGAPDVVVHMAWRDGFVHNSHAHIDDLSAHAHFIENLYQGGLKQLAVMGTMHEVGYWEGAITADTPCHPLSLYGISKNALRDIAMMHAKDFNAQLQWIRAYYIVGDDARGNSIFSKLLTAANEGKKHFPFTSGKNLYDFISVTQLARQISAIVSQTEIDGIINACSGVPMTLADRVEKYIEENNLDIELQYGAYPDRDYDSPGVWGDATKINEILRSAK